MANKIILKKSSVAAKVPLSTDLDYGELALNYTDGKLYYKKSDNTIAAIASSTYGSVSGLDADLLDGLHASAFALTSHSHTWDGITNKPLQLLTESIFSSSINPGWYTIAINPGDRASAKFIIADGTSGLHQTIHFYVSHHFGIGNNITVVHNDYYGAGGPVRYIRIKEGDTYNGALVQIYLDSTSTSLAVYMYEDVQDRGFTIKTFIADGTDPGGLNNFAALTNIAAQVDLDNASMVVSDDIYIGGATTQYKALHAGNYNTYSPTLTGIGASGTWGINITGSAATLTTPRTLTIGSTGKTFTGATDVSWSLSEIGAEAQSAYGIPRSNLGSPTVREMALFDEQFNNKTAFYNIAYLKFYTSTDGITWTEYTGFSDTQKRQFLGGDVSSGIIIPNGTPYFRIELINDGDYVFLDALYMYWSSNSHSTTVKIRAQRGDGVWSQWTNSSTQVGSWPGHLFLPFTSIAFNPSTTSTGHYRTVHFDFQPTWSTGQYASQNINLYKFQVWGGYPAGKRNVYATDELKNVTFPANLGAKKLELADTNSQLRLSYTSGSIYSDIYTDASGNINIGATGAFLNVNTSYLNMSGANGTILLGAGGFAAGGDIVFRSAGAGSTTINPVFRIKDSTGALQDGLRFNNTWVNSIPGTLRNAISISSLGTTICNIDATSTTSTINYLGNVGVGVPSPAEKLEVSGNIKHTGLSPTEGTNIDQIKTITRALTLSTDWQDVGISGTDLAIGTYAVQLYANDSGAGGYNTNEYYSGTMSWYNGGTFTSAELPSDEITLHRAGASSDAGLYLRTYRVSGGTLKLQIYSNYATASSSNYVFKFRRLI